ncbi:hypothetical protein RJD24_11900 [Bacillaceae bacterium IKA-2]|nr:hypothetical protein RJD24_11900 [Bacillaceae bacterium IKA-2]
MGIQDYFLDGNTSQGYLTLVRHVVVGCDNVYIIKGSISKEKTKLFKEISELFEKDNYLVQWLHNPSDEAELDGIIIPEKSIAVIDGSSRNGIEANYGLFSKDRFDLDEVISKEQLYDHKKTIIGLQNEYEIMHKQAYQQFNKGREIHEQKEKLYIAAMDFEKANKVTEDLIKTIFVDISVKVEKPIIAQLFFGASTPNGAVNYIENITSEIKKRYIIKGRSGCGKSTVMRKVAKYAENIGLAVQYFPCGLDPDSLDMIIIPTLSVAIIDGTAPHVIDPTRHTDQVVDMFELCMDKTVETKYDKEFEQLHSNYRDEVRTGTNFLQEAKKARNSLEEYYQEAVNVIALKEKFNEIIAVLTKELR